MTGLSDTVRARCPACGELLRARRPRGDGRVVSCPACGAELRLAGDGFTPVPPPPDGSGSPRRGLPGAAATVCVSLVALATLGWLLLSPPKAAGPDARESKGIATDDAEARVLPFDEEGVRNAPRSRNGDAAAEAGDASPRTPEGASTDGPGSGSDDENSPSPERHPIAVALAEPKLTDNRSPSDLQHSPAASGSEGGERIRFDSIVPSPASPLDVSVAFLGRDRMNERLATRLSRVVADDVPLRDYVVDVIDLTGVRVPFPDGLEGESVTIDRTGVTIRRLLKEALAPRGYRLVVRDDGSLTLVSTERSP